jgi:hypothetical protein
MELYQFNPQTRFKVCLSEVNNYPQTDCVTIGKTTHIGVFVIPGLTRNPLFFQSFTLLDAGSSPA